MPSAGGRRPGTSETRHPVPHVPHLYLPPPWEGERIPLDEGHRHHVRVLRMESGQPLTYTDGRGTRGAGSLRNDTVERGVEQSLPPPRPRLTLAVAPPRATERARFLVEKSAELGVDRLTWLDTSRGEGRPPRPAKSAAWAAAALEQSRGVWLLEIDGPLRIQELGQPLWVLERGASSTPRTTGDVILAAGPEGGFAPGEVRVWAEQIGVGERVLRVETAAIVGAALVLDRMGRLA
jgi:16S rRNA (uracil1498-N3)-methyltransferase